jgi:hypothetical protein
VLCFFTNMMLQRIVGYYLLFDLYRSDKYPLNPFTPFFLDAAEAGAAKQAAFDEAKKETDGELANGKTGTENESPAERAERQFIVHLLLPSSSSRGV